MTGGNRDLDAPARRQSDVDIEWLDRDFSDCAVNTVIASGDNADLCAVVVSDFRHVLGLDVLVARRVHLVARRQIDPKLEAFHQAVFLLWHLGMDDAASCGHPLNAARAQHSTAARCVLVAHAPVDHVGHGLKAAMGVVGEARNVVFGIFGVELVE